MKNKRIDKIMLILGFFAIIIGGSISVYAATYLFSADTVSYSNTNTSINATDAQCALDELYKHANDHKEIENYFKNSATSFFDGSKLRIAYRSSNTTSNKGLVIYNGTSHTPRSYIYYIPGSDLTRLEALKSDGSAGGILDLKGSPVTINGTKFQSMLYMKTFNVNATVGAGSLDSLRTVNVAQSGYTPLIAHCDSDVILLNTWYCNLNGSNVSFRAKNFSNHAASAYYKIYVLYVKNT